MDLGATFRCSLARAPDDLAIVDGDRRLTWREFDAAIRRVAAGLLAKGLGPGDHVLAVLANRLETATLYWACQMLGLIFTPFNWRASGEDVAYVLADAEAKFVVFEDRSAAAVDFALRAAGYDRARTLTLDAPAAGSERFESLLDFEPIAAARRVEPAQTSLMLYTSGTTGRPKGVPRSHAAERAAAIACLAQLGYRYGESTLGAMPLFHTMGIRSLLMSMLLNGRFVCMPSFDVATAFKLIEREGITALFLVPTMFHDMVHHPDFDAFDLGSVRNLAYAGMSMTTALTEKCAARFKPERFSNFYGSSEIYTFSVCDHVIEKPGSAGRAGFGQELKLVRADAGGGAGVDEIVAPGEAGEIIATMQSDEAFAGYWKRPDADARSIRDGWYFTGDLGRLDEDGELYIIGRVDDMIVSGGENIYPEEVEDVLDKSDLVRQAAVIGMADARMGEKVVAYIEPASPAATAKALDEACLKSGLARFKRPRAYVFVERIPRSASGKLLRRELRSGNYRQLSDYDTTL